MENLLRQWGLESLLPNFLEEGIDEDTLVLLDEETIKNIIPKAGPRLKFKKKLKDYINANKENNQDIVCYDSNSDTVTITPSTSTSTTLDSIFHEDYIYAEDTDLCESLHVTQNIPQDQSLLRAPCCSRSNSDLSINQPSSSQTSPSLKRIKTTNIFPGGLESLLQTTVDGKIVLANRLKLNNDHRQKLCREIINHFLSVCDNCTASLFSEAAEEICKLFPNEAKEIYYIPYQPKSGSSPKLSAKGKLWSRYVNVRSALRIINTTNIDSPLNIEFTEDNEPEGESMFNCLRSLVEPQTKVLEYWQATYSYRRKVFAKNLVSEIFEQIPALKLQIGAELITCDFNEKYPEKCDIIYLNFPKVAQAILNESKKRKICFTENCHDVDQYILALLTLPYLFTPVTLRNNVKRSNWRPSRSEVQESMIVHVTNYYEVQDIVERRKKKLKEYRLTLQPYMVALGPLNKLESYYVVIDDTQYCFDSPIRALEVIFKAFHAFDMKYPYESQHIWIFIEEIVFQMKTSPRNAAASALIADLKPYL